MRQIFIIPFVLTGALLSGCGSSSSMEPYEKLDAAGDESSDIGSDTGNNTSPDTGNNTGPDAGNNTDPDTGNNTESDTGDNTGPDTGDNTGPDTGNNTDPDTGNNTESDTGDNTGPDTGNNTEPDTGDNTGPDTGNNTDPDTGNNTDPDTGDNTDPDTGDNTEPDAGNNSDVDKETEDNVVDVINFTPNWQELRPASNDQSCITGKSVNSVLVETCDSADNQQWAVSPQGLLKHKGTGLCLDAAGLASAESVILSECAIAVSQVWQKQGTSWIIDNMALDLNQANNQVIVYPFHGGTNQQWLQESSQKEPDLPQEPNNNDTNDNDSNNSSSNADVNALHACPTGSEIYALTPSAGVARMGSVFSKTLYNPHDETNNNKTHQPQQIQIQVSNGGSPVANCQVAWLTNETGNASAANGWVFPDSQFTDSQGKISAWWTAGDAYEQMVNVVIKREDGTTHASHITGQAQPHTTRSNSIHINWSTQKWDHFSVDVTPLTMPATTYYSAINFPGGYTGLQTNKYLFSIWDVNGIDAEIVNPGIATCTGFGGEGTGAKCYVEINPVVNNTYRFEVIASYPISGRTDYTMYFTDIKNGQRTFVAHLRYGTRVEPDYAAGFVEDWWEPGSSCLETNERTAYFHNVKYKKGNKAFNKITSARATAVYNQWHNEICANYDFKAVGDKFMWSSGGKKRVGYPQNVENTANVSNIITIEN